MLLDDDDFVSILCAFDRNVISRIQCASTCCCVVILILCGSKLRRKCSKCSFQNWVDCRKALAGWLFELLHQKPIACCGFIQLLDPPESNVFAGNLDKATSKRLSVAMADLLSKRSAEET